MNRKQIRSASCSLYGIAMAAVCIAGAGGTAIALTAIIGAMLVALLFTLTRGR